MLKRWRKIPWRIRMIIASPFLALLLLMFIGEMLGRSIRGCYYLVGDLWRGAYKLDDFMDYMWKRK